MIPRGVLRLLRRIADSEDGELVWEQGGGWWIDCDRTRGLEPQQAVVLCLISCDDVGSDFQRWTLNEEGRAALDDAGYQPKILPTLRKALLTCPSPVVRCRRPAAGGKNARTSHRKPQTQG